MAQKEKRFVVSEAVVEGGKKKKIASFDTYEEACNYVERLAKSRIPFCSVKDKDYGKQMQNVCQTGCANAAVESPGLLQEGNQAG
jgi:hypothetical protein